MDRQIEVTYARASDYKQVPATGAFGGPTPTGSIVCNFYIESQVFPDKIEVTVKPGGQVDKENIYEKGPDVYIRELLVGVVLSPDVAQSVGEWLIRQAKTQAAGTMH